jgi:hypothetical protein
MARDVAAWRCAGRSSIGHPASVIVDADLTAKGANAEEFE